MIRFRDGTIDIKLTENLIQPEIYYGRGSDKRDDISEMSPV